MSVQLGQSVYLRRDDEGGFPDDEKAPGPTLISTASLETVTSWFEGIDIESMRRRLRTNIEIDGVPAFWEDGLYGVDGAPGSIQIGAVTLWVTNPCQRCVVPSRDPDTGLAIAAFSKRLSERRVATLPGWAERSRFDHFYRLAVNTRPPSEQIGNIIAVGDSVTFHSVPPQPLR